VSHLLSPGIVRPLSWLGLFLVAAGAAWTLWTLRTTGWARLLGRPVSGPALWLRGPYRFVRHPMWTGLLSVLLGLLLWRPGWSSAVALLAGVVGAESWVALNEPKCRCRFGEAYRRYQTAVPALFPRLRRRD